MRRHCDGRDPNLIRKARPDEPMPWQFPWWQNEAWRPCDCGRVFDDVNTSVVYPHDRF